jgi:hypothetical protein
MMYGKCIFDKYTRTKFNFFFVKYKTKERGKNIKFSWGLT